MSLTNKLIKYALPLFAFAVILSACSKPESSLKQSSVNTESTALQNVSTSTPVPPTIAPIMASKPMGCKTIHMIAVCVQDITRSDKETQVRLNIAVESPMVSGAGEEFSFISPDYQNEIYPALFDEYGHLYPLINDADNNLTQFDDVERVYFQTLHFQPILADAKKLTVSWPITAVDTPSKTETFQIDLGPNPQPGQTLPLDVTTTIDGQIFHFVKAEFGGDGVHSLTVTLYMDPVKLPGDIFLMSPSFGDPVKGVFFGGKFGTPYKITSDLMVPPGKSSGLTANTYVSGVLNIVVDRITYWFRGPFEITYQLP